MPILTRRASQRQLAAAQEATSSAEVSESTANTAAQGQTKKNSRKRANNSTNRTEKAKRRKRKTQMDHGNDDDDVTSDPKSNNNDSDNTTEDTLSELTNDAFGAISEERNEHTDQFDDDYEHVQNEESESEEEPKIERRRTRSSSAASQAKSTTTTQATQSKQKRRPKSQETKRRSKKRDQPRVPWAILPKPAEPMEITYCFDDLDYVRDNFFGDYYYSPRYYTEDTEFRHVILPKELLNYIPDDIRGRLLTEMEWRSLGIIMSPGWENYLIHKPEPWVYCFRRELHYSEKYGALTAEEYKQYKEYLAQQEAEKSKRQQEEKPVLGGMVGIPNGPSQDMQSQDIKKRKSSSALLKDDVENMNGDISLGETHQGVSSMDSRGSSRR